jgi:hypothetical protein
MKDIYGMMNPPKDLESEEHIDPELVIPGNGLCRIPVNERCPCTDRISFMFQCSHEYHRDGQFVKELYNPKQWYTRRVYDKWISIEEPYMHNDDDYPEPGDPIEGTLEALKHHEQRTVPPQHDQDDSDNQEVVIIDADGPLNTFHGDDDDSEDDNDWSGGRRRKWTPKLFFGKTSVR